MTTLLHEVHEGMVVYDQEQNELGTVDRVQFGDEDPHKPGVETASVNPVQRDKRDSLLENVIDVFRPDDIPRELRASLLRYGFIRIDSPGLFNADRYVLPHQIKSVADDRVMLNVTKSELIQRP